MLSATTRANLRALLIRVAEEWAPPLQIPTREWLSEHYRLPEEGADLPGAYNPDYVPYLWGIWHALDDPATRVVVLQKAAQIGWTFGMIGWLGKRVHTDPSPIIGLFPKDGAAREFADEKFVPAVKATPVLRERISTTTRKNGVRALYKPFPGGFLKLVGSNSISNVKSTPAPLVVVEEPDDTSENIKDQGDAIRLARERLKRFRKGKLVLGGTPSVEGLSRVQEFLELTDQRVLPVECHACRDAHVLDWDNVSWLTADSGPEHPVYGWHQPDTAVYTCPHCGTAWDDWQRQQNILNTVRAAAETGDPWCGWTPTVDSAVGASGFKALSELYVCLPGTNLADVVRDHLEAEHDAGKGDESGRIVFVNSKLGKPYRYQDEQADEEQLQAVARDYPELQAPDGVLLVTLGVDVQHDRLAIILRGWGRNEESWLLYWGEIYADNTCADKNDPIWQALDTIAFGPLAHEQGLTLYPAGISIDASDGVTTDAVYHWVRTRSRQHRQVQIMAIKGSSARQDLEIFSTPKLKSIDHHRPDKQTKADRHGVKVYLVGTNKAKDWLAGQLKLEAQGRGRFHYYRDVRVDYYAQITSEVKAPHRSIRNRRIWQLRSHRRNEALDGEVYALHAARALRVHLAGPKQWDALDATLRQADLFTPTSAAAPSNRRLTPRGH